MKAESRSTLVTALLLVVGCAGVGLAVAKLWAAAPGWFFGGDLVAYVGGARRLSETGSPYHPLMFETVLSNTPEDVSLAYLYPPPLAQLFALLPPTDPTTLTWAWIALQLVVLALVLPSVARHYAPAAPPVQRLALVLAFAATSFALSFALNGGNVSAWVAAGIGLLLIGGPRTRGVTAAGLTLLKAVPAPLLLIALVSRPSRLPAALTLTVGVAASFLLAPEGWLDWVRTWPHIAGMTPGTAPYNLSPAAGAAQLGLEGLGRVTGLGLAIAFGAGGALLAAGGRWPAAVAAATTSTLLVSPTLWDHYLVATVPLVVAAWWDATPMERAVFVVSWAAMIPMWFGPNPGSVNAGRNLDNNRRLKAEHPQRSFSAVSTSSRLPRSL